MEFNNIESGFYEANNISIEISNFFFSFGKEAPVIFKCANILAEVVPLSDGK